VVSGHASAAIPDQATALRADLIIMGTHGASGFERLLLGSVTEKVLRKAACPVMTVPPRVPSSAGATAFTKILCPIDFSTPSIAALEYASSIAESASAGLSVLHVIEWPWHEPPAPAFEELPREQAAALAEYRRYLERLATDRLKAVVLDAVGAAGSPETLIRHGKPHVEILRAADERDADLIVIGLHGRNIADRADRALFGSTANHVVRQAVCPVLTLRE
jgi:nucleotide-binding universal stress UspA family protein